MADFRDYVSFEVPEKIKSHGLDQGDTKIIPLKGEHLSLIENALEEISNKPEGLEILKNVAAEFPEGKIPFLDHDGGRTLVAFVSEDVNNEMSAILIGTKDSNARYYSPQTQEFHDISIQRAIFHELKHFELGHIESYHDGITADMKVAHEVEAVKATNDFMGKYYDEPLRSEDLFIAKYDGTEEWDFSTKVQTETGLDGWLNKLKSTFCDVTDLCENNGLESKNTHSAKPQELGI